MTAFYPLSVRKFSTKVDLVNSVMADHVNSLQDEVTAIETTLSKDILTPSYTGVFSSSPVIVTVNDRLTNIEAGLVNGVPSAPYVSTNGGSVVAAAGVLGVGLSATSGSLNLLEAYQQAAPNAVRFNIDFDGYPKVGSNRVLWVNSTEYNSLVGLVSANSQSITDALNTATFHPFLIAGM